jgi:hypothetical protein
VEEPRRPQSIYFVDDTSIERWPLAVSRFCAWPLATLGTDERVA